jgi:MFS family permease
MCCSDWSAESSRTRSTGAGCSSRGLLLIFTFLIGSGSVIALPAYASLVPEIVPRSQIVAATTLGSIGINVARAVGPAVAGL